MEPSSNRLCGRRCSPIHSIPYSVAYRWRAVYKYYSFIIRGGDDHIVQLDRCGVTGDDAGTKGIDDALQDDVAYRDEALLQDAGDGDHGYLAQHVPGEEHHLVGGLEGTDAAEHHHHGQHAAHALAQEGGPCHTGVSHS